MDNDRLAEVERQNALLQIDLEWEKERQGYLFRGVQPTPLMFIAPVVITAIASLVLLALTFQVEGANVLGILGIAMLLLLADRTGHHVLLDGMCEHALDPYDLMVEVTAGPVFRNHTVPDVFQILRSKGIGGLGPVAAYLDHGEGVRDASSLLVPAMVKLVVLLDELEIREDQVIHARPVVGDQQLIGGRLRGILTFAPRPDQSLVSSVAVGTAESAEVVVVAVNGDDCEIPGFVVAVGGDSACFGTGHGADSERIQYTVLDNRVQPPIPTIGRIALSRYRLDTSVRAGDRIRTGDVQLGNPQGTDPIPLVDKQLAPTPSDACTNACTESPKTAKATDLDALAAELMKLPKDERARLMAKLLGDGDRE